MQQSKRRDPMGMPCWNLGSVSIGTELCMRKQTHQVCCRASLFLGDVLARGIIRTSDLFSCE